MGGTDGSSLLSVGRISVVAPAGGIGEFALVLRYVGGADADGDGVIGLWWCWVSLGRHWLCQATYKSWSSEKLCRASCWKP